MLSLVTLSILAQAETCEMYACPDGFQSHPAMLGRECGKNGCTPAQCCVPSSFLTQCDFFTCPEDTEPVREKVECADLCTVAECCSSHSVEPPVKTCDTFFCPDRTHNIVEKNVHCDGDCSVDLCCTDVDPVDILCDFFTCPADTVHIGEKDVRCVDLCTVAECCSSHSVEPPVENATCDTFVCPSGCSAGVGELSLDPKFETASVAGSESGSIWNAEFWSAYTGTPARASDVDGPGDDLLRLKKGDAVAITKPLGVGTYTINVGGNRPTYGKGFSMYQFGVVNTTGDRVFASSGTTDRNYDYIGAGAYGWDHPESVTFTIEECGNYAIYYKNIDGDEMDSHTLTVTAVTGNDNCCVGPQYQHIGESDVSCNGATCTVDQCCFSVVEPTVKPTFAPISALSFMCYGKHVVLETSHEWKVKVLGYEMKGNKPARKASLKQEYSFLERIPLPEGISCFKAQAKIKVGKRWKKVSTLKKQCCGSK